jgi:hypothetical protein
MLATMAGQGSPVQLEQSDMSLALSMARMSKAGSVRATIEETQQLVNTPCADVQEAKMRGDVFPWHNKVKAAMESHLAIVCGNQTEGCLPCQNGTLQNPQICWRHKAMSAPPLHLTPPQP